MRPLRYAVLMAGLALLAHSATWGQTAYKIQPIIALGERAAGLRINPKGDFEIEALNDQGQLLFITEHETQGEGEYLFLYADGQFTPIVIPRGDAAGGEKFAGEGGVRGASMNQQGNILFAADVGSMGNLGTFRWDAKTRSLSAVARTGMPAVNNLTFANGGSNFGPGTINNSDEVAFGASIKNAAGEVRDGIFFLGRDNKLQAVALPDQALPGGGQIDFAYFPSANDAGTIAFLARRKGDKVSSAYLWEQGTITPVAVIGMDTPGGGKLGEVWRVWTNNKNRNLLVATRVGDNTGPTHLYLLAGGKLMPVVVPGQEMPGGGKFKGLQADIPDLILVGGNPVGFTFGVSVANSLGQHVFLARLEDGSAAAYLMDADGKLSLIMKSGMNTDLGPIKAIGEMGQVGGGLADSIRAALNSRGQVALTMAIGDRPPTLFLLTPIGP